MTSAKNNVKSGRGSNENFYSAQARRELLLQETPYYTNPRIAHGMHTSCRCCFHGYCWRTVSCCIPGNDGNIIVTVLLHISQSMGPGITRHRLHDIATSKPTVIFHEGVSDEILVDHFSSWLCPGEADGGGVRGGATEVSRGGRDNNCRAKVTVMTTVL